MRNFGLDDTDYIDFLPTERIEQYKNQMNFHAEELRGITAIQCAGYAAQLRFAAHPARLPLGGFALSAAPGSRCHSSSRQELGVFWYILMNSSNYGTYFALHIMQCTAH
jgi:hypothetical protein